MGKHFPWFYLPDISFTNQISEGPLFYMQHLFFKNAPCSSFYDLIKENLLDFMDIKALIRVKANFYPNQKIKKLNEPHIDFDYNHKGALFSINTNNGGTLLKNNVKINSIENRILFFNPFEEHDSENCTDQKVRINININYF